MNDVALEGETLEWAACFLALLTAGKSPKVAMTEATDACELLDERQKARSVEAKHAWEARIAGIYDQRVYCDACEPTKLFYVREVSGVTVYFTDGSQCDISDLDDAFRPASNINVAVIPALVPPEIKLRLDAFGNTGSSVARAALEGAIAGELQRVARVDALAVELAAEFSVDVYRDTGVGLTFTTMNEAARVLARDGGTALVKLSVTGPGRR